MPQKENRSTACKVLSVIGLDFSITGLICSVILPLLLSAHRSNADYLDWGIVGTVAGSIFLIGIAFIGGIVGILMSIIIMIYLLIKQRTKEIALPIAGIVLGTAAIIITVLTLTLL